MQEGADAGRQRLYWFAVAADSLIRLSERVRVREMEQIMCTVRNRTVHRCENCWHSPRCERRWVHQEIAPMGAMRLVGGGSEVR